MKRKIENLLRLTEREGIEELLKYMDEQGFYTAPCSSQYHLPVPGGLAEHSLNVYNTIINFAESILSDDEYFDMIESLTIVSLLHDVGKMGIDYAPHYEENYLKDGSLSKSKPYAINKALCNVPHEILSLSIIERYIKLTHEERFAIMAHNSAYGPLWYQIKGNETPLYMLLHFADLWCAKVVEK